MPTNYPVAHYPFSPVHSGAKDLAKQPNSQDLQTDEGLHPTGFEGFHNAQKYLPIPDDLEYLLLYLLTALAF